MRIFLTALVATMCLGVVSCVMPSDLEGLAQAQRAAQADLEEAQVVFQADVRAILADQALTAEERDLALEQARGLRDESVSKALDDFADASEAIAKAVEERTKNTIHAPLPITGNPLLDVILNLGGTALAGVGATNAVRDRRRHKRGEPVDPTSTPT